VAERQGVMAVSHPHAAAGEDGSGNPNSCKLGAQHPTHSTTCGCSMMPVGCPNTSHTMPVFLFIQDITCACTCRRQMTSC
jgi:hypothetical protein